MKNKKLHFFKNDPFDIKYKIFNLKMNYYLKRSFKIKLKILIETYNIVRLIKYPKNESEAESLLYAINKFDENIKKLQEVFEAPRMYIKNFYIENYLDEK